MKVLSFPGVYKKIMKMLKKKKKRVDIREAKWQFDIITCLIQGKKDPTPVSCILKGHA